MSEWLRGAIGLFTKGAAAERLVQILDGELLDGLGHGLRLLLALLRRLLLLHVGSPLWGGGGIATGLDFALRTREMHEADRR